MARREHRRPHRPRRRRRMRLRRPRHRRPRRDRGLGAVQHAQCPPDCCAVTFCPAPGPFDIRADRFTPGNGVDRGPGRHLYLPATGKGNTTRLGGQPIDYGEGRAVTSSRRRRVGLQRRPLHLAEVAGEAMSADPRDALARVPRPATADCRATTKGSAQPTAAHHAVALGSAADPLRRQRARAGSAAGHRRRPRQPQPHPEPGRVQPRTARRRRRARPRRRRRRPAHAGRQAGLTDAEILGKNATAHHLQRARQRQADHPAASPNTT